ncbi:MAG: phage major tail tube protein [Janthinobacterium lividum]
MATIFTNESFTIYVGNDDPGNDKRKSVTNLSLPDLEELTASHHAGGSRIEVEVAVGGMKALMVKFKATGWDSQTMSQMGVSGRANYPFTLKSVVRDKATGRGLGVKVVVWGRLTKLSPSEQKRGDLFGHDHEIKEIVHYELHYDDSEKYYWDYASTPEIWRVDGEVQNQDDIDYL